LITNAQCYGFVTCELKDETDMSQKIIRRPNEKYGSTSYPIHPSFQYFIVLKNCLSTAFATLNEKGKKKKFGSL